MGQGLGEWSELKISFHFLLKLIAALQHQRTKSYVKVFG